jgi:hypothetical protein
MREDLSVVFYLALKPLVSIESVMQCFPDPVELAERVKPGFSSLDPIELQRASVGTKG